MNLFTGLAAVTALSAATSVLSEGSSENADVVIALGSATNSASVASVEPPRTEELAGRYEIDGGAEFFIATDGDESFIEFPEALGFESPRLRADASGAFFVAEVAVLVTFDRDVEGRVVGATIHPSSAQSAIIAVKTALPRGIVTVHDIVSPRSGIVSIHDVADNAETAPAF